MAKGKISRPRRPRLRKVPPPAPPVGTVIELSEKMTEKIDKAFQPITELQGELGRLRADFLIKEAQFMQAMGNAQKTYNETVMAAGKEAGVPVGPDAEGNWRFDFAQKKFTRTS